MKVAQFITIGVIVGILVAIASFPLWRPFFVNEVVDEAFPFSQMTEEQQKAFEALPQEQQTELMKMADMALQTSISMSSPDSAMNDDMPTAENPALLKSGSFVEIDAIHKAQGTAMLYDVGNGERVVRFEDFRSTNGPELHVLLTKGTEHQTFASVGDDYIDLGRLKGNVGNQNYTIPAEINLEEYTAVVIYCLPFRVVFSVADLS